MGLIQAQSQPTAKGEENPKAALGFTGPTIAAYRKLADNPVSATGFTKPLDFAKPIRNRTHNWVRFFVGANVSFIRGYSVRLSRKTQKTTPTPDYTRSVVFVSFIA
ncbi:hypothetical protein [Novipirellula artificiosorum]|uniref:Uncharacterized protein n=1 Tax=Novipirellula artificiosorum TaxID=2528016 RepID=A0A5C6DK94_9BACT|nr:hypothetical protein [Novipirellula artificiosorum]TWU36031.1 hypothetical protein Poly41_37840 [Novipirellula artificiosorum]